MNKEEAAIWLEHKYPLTIIADRYGGTYSGGAFTAWPLECWDVSSGIGEAESECEYFWEQTKGSIFGKGSTPKEALDDLREQVKELKGGQERSPYTETIRPHKWPTE